MFPFVPSGSVLALRPAAPAAIAVGDIVVYPARLAPGEPPALVAHRVVGIDGATLAVRGDAVGCSTIQQLTAAELVFVDTRVTYRGVSYGTGGVLGRALARIAARRGLGWRLATSAANVALALRRLMAAQASPLTAADGVIRLAESRPSFVVPSDESSRDSLLRGLKHELRTPLNAILGFSDLLLGELDGPLDGDERENVSVVREAGAKLLALINEVLDLATALVTPGDPVYEDVDATVLVEEVRAELEEQSGMRPVHVRVDGALEQLDACIERRLLLRVLRTLGAVALEVTAAGEIALRANTTENGMLQLRLRADGFAGRATEELAQLVPPRIAHERARRLLAMRLAIAQRLVATHPGALSGEPDGSLLIEVPAQPAPVTTDEAQAEADVAMALSYMAAMGHDLRTPLNAILGFADLLSVTPHRPWSASQQRSLEIVRERAVDLAALIDEMIDWAKLEAGELELKRSITPLLPLVEKARDAALKRSGARGLRIVLSADPDLGSLRVDGARVVQALVGLLDHAIRSNPGPRVSIRVERAPSGLRVEIIDPGLEIRAEDHTAVFDAFRPSHAPTGQRIAGLQLGTSVGRSLVRAHGGDVCFESRPGRGTTFVATLPLL
jgi:signal transduction histidine kinase